MPQTKRPLRELRSQTRDDMGAPDLETAARNVVEHEKRGGRSEPPAPPGTAVHKYHTSQPAFYRGFWSFKSITTCKSITIGTNPSQLQSVGKGRRQRQRK